jgi:TonB family protein
VQVDDESRSDGEGSSFPLYISLSIGAVFLATLGVIGFVTFRNVEATPGYVVSIHAASAAAQPVSAATALTVAVEAPVQARAEHRAHIGPRHVAALPKVVASAAPKSSPTPDPSPTPRATVSLPPAPRDAAQAKKTKAHQGLAARRIAEATSEQGSDADPVPATRPVWASTAGPVQPVTTAAPAAVVTSPPVHEAPATSAPAPAPTPAVVAAAPAPVYAPDRIVEARVRSAVQPEFPSDPSVQGARGTSSVLVTIGSHGDVLKVALDKSSGHFAFDQAALNAARASAYDAPQINGHAATASYRMVYEFSQ